VLTLTALAQSLKTLIRNKSNFAQMRQPALGLKQRLQERQARIRAMQGEDAEQCQDELPVLEELLKVL
jgi:hypothetical protein